jgi:hypothetical protein
MGSLQVSIATPPSGVFLGLYLETERLGDRLQVFHRGGGDFRADAVSGKQYDSVGGAHHGFFIAKTPGL